jgi:sugar diacid utilization regulator
MLSVTERARRELLEDLLIHGEEVGDDQQRRAAAVGLEPGDSLVAVALPAEPGCDDPEMIARFEQAVARSTRVRRAPFVTVRRDEIVAVVRSPRDDGSGLARALNRRLETKPAPSIRVGISTAAKMPAGLARGYAEARAALAHATDRTRVAALADVSLFDYLTSHADRTAERVAPEACRLLLAADRGELVGTLHAYTEADLNVARAAERLFVHPNTVHYRLRRIEEITGMSMRCWGDLVELTAGLALLRRTAGDES